MDVMRYH